MDTEGGSFFSRLPMWAKVIFVVIWPISLTYGVYRMWKTQAFNMPIRVVATALACVVAISVLGPGGEASSGTDREGGPPAASQTASVADSAAVETEPLDAEAAAPAVTVQQTSGAIKTVAASVTRIVDGDTIEVSMPNGSSDKVRFIGVDTPECTNQNEPYGDEASEFTANALTGKTVYLETDAEERDRYGRLLAHVWLQTPAEVDDTTIREHLFNARLVLAGYASLMTIPPNVKYVEYLTVYQSEARTAAVGLWGPAPTEPTSDTEPSSPSAAYIANKNTGKFHRADCSSVDDMNESNKVPYDSREEAIADGYEPCKRCNP